MLGTRGDRHIIQNITKNCGIHVVDMQYVDINNKSKST